MKSKGNIVFLGMMGSGKTTIGKLISKKLNQDFFDIDKCIENQEGMKISEIFEKKGENFFREIEQKISLDFLNKKDAVIALGGGAFLNGKIREKVLNNHFSFWLKWNSKILIERMIRSTKRPIANKLTKKDLIELIKKRSYIYSKSLYKIECNNLTKFQIMNKIINIYETNKIDS